MLCFLDTEFTSLVDPQLLSIGLVTLDGRECYVELDMGSEVGRARRAVASDFVRHDGVLDMWRLVPDATASAWEMGRRTGEWLLRLPEASETRVEVAFDFGTDFELMASAISDSGLWDKVREAVTPVDIGPLTGSPEGEIAAEHCFREMHRRGLARHHALADAGALRAAYIAVKAVALRMASAVHSEAYCALAKHAAQLGLDEAWLRAWIRNPAFALGGRLPIDRLSETGGLDELKDIIVRLAHDVY